MSIPRLTSLRDGVTGELHAGVADVLLALAVAVVSLASTIPHVEGSLVTLELSASLAIRRTHPAAALAVGTSAAFVHVVLSTSLPVAAVAIPMLVYSLARWSGRILAWSALGVGLAGAVIGPVRWLVPRADTYHVQGILVTIAAYAGVIVVAYVLGQRGRERAEAQVQREHERAERRRLESAEERNEIAREVHDIVAHSLSMIAVQAEGGRALAARSPDGAAAVLSEIADEARSALNEIRDMVRFLRQGRLSGVSSHEGHRPAPGLGDVRELVGRLGDRAGLRIAGRVRPIGPLVAFTVHRVVQEALTNFVRHAGPSATVQVTVAFGDDAVEVTVLDDGLGAAAAAASDGKGNGLHTMKERVLAHGGTVTAGPLTGGGYEVHAALPCSSASVSPVSPGEYWLRGKARP